MTSTGDNPHPPPPTENSVRQLSDRQTNPQTLTNPNITTKLDFRVSVLVKDRYMQLSPEKKKIVKLVLESVIFTLANDNANLQAAAKELGLELAKQNIQPIVNINVNVAEAKAEAKVKIDVEQLLEKLNEIEKLLLSIQKYTFDPAHNTYRIPPARMKELADLVKQMRGLLN